MCSSVRLASDLERTSAIAIADETAHMDTKNKKRREREREREREKKQGKRRREKRKRSDRKRVHSTKKAHLRGGRSGELERYLDVS
jgi:hypothetical protein